MKKLVTRDEACTGCRMCEAVCSTTHFGESNPAKSRIIVREDGRQGVFAPLVCRQCADPPCIEACPAAAMRLDPVFGNPVVDQASCTRCLACVEACPFRAIFTDAATGSLLLCDLCGGDPACARSCRRYPHRPHAALEWVQTSAPRPLPLDGGR